MVGFPLSCEFSAFWGGNLIKQAMQVDCKFQVGNIISPVAMVVPGSWCDAVESFLIAV